MKNALNLRFAIQKSGRLSEDSIKLLLECGLRFDSNRGNNRLRSEASNFPIEFIFLRDDDIPGYVADGVVDVGIIGENVLYEKYGSEPAEVLLYEKLGFSQCQLSIAVPKSFGYKGLSDFNGKKIATSHPRLLKDFLERKNISANIHEISGSVEIAPSMGLADAICDLVGSGSTLVSNGLKEVETILLSQAVLIANGALSAERRAILDKLVFRVKAVLRASNSKYVLLNAPNEAIEKITSILPGMKSPTVVPLANPGWSSIHSVMNENEFWEKIDSLREAGAEGILIIPIEKMVV
jgi:ATP phosphoribosyltransferase